jgi:DNA-directed RNA polymerase subunit RPC12/RpoP
MGPRLTGHYSPLPFWEECEDKLMTSYSMDVRCTNCRWKGTVDLPKGVVATESNLPVCTNCGCKTLTKATLHVPKAMWDRKNYQWDRRYIPEIEKYKAG